MRRCRQEHTSREYNDWMTFFEIEAEEDPGIVANYLMRTMAEIRMANSGKPITDLSQFRVEFKRASKALGNPSEPTEEELRIAHEASVSRWHGRLGLVAEH